MPPEKSAWDVVFEGYAPVNYSAHFGSSHEADSLTCSAVKAQIQQRLATAVIPFTVDTNGYPLVCLILVFILSVHLFLLHFEFSLSISLSYSLFLHIYLLYLNMYICSSLTVVDARP